MLNTRRTVRRRLFSGAAPYAMAFAAGLVLLPTARADDQADPPTRVGRISVIQGTVSFHPSPDDQWGPAVVNYPVAASTAVWADDNAQAQVEIGAARIRLDADTELDIVQLDDQNVVLSVPQGRVDISLHGRESDETYDIQTPRGDVDLLADGSYRVFSGTDSEPTRVAAFAGQAQLVGGSSQISVGANQEMAATPGTTVSYSVGPASQDAFDQAFFPQVQRIYAHPAPAYVPPMPGVASLSEYGAWRDDATYGHLWIPTGVAAGWAPYHDGHWGYIAPWGYTWIDNSPWGFAPFHYGRWVQVGGAWGWVPVERGAEIQVGFHPVYAPAMVTFIGNPAALTVGVNFGGGAAVGWVPLGPGEPWHPWYHVSDNYVRQANIVNVNRTVITNITNNTVINRTTYINQRAATVVPAAAFSGGRPIQEAAIRIPPAALARPIEAAPAAEVRERILPKPEAAVVVGGGEHPVHVPPRPALVMKHPAAASAAAFHEHPPAPNAALEKAGASTRPGEIARPTEAIRPEAVRPGEVARPVEPNRPGEAVTRPEAHPAEAARPGEAAHPAAGEHPAATETRGEAKRPAEAAHPEAAHPEATRPEAARPEAAHPEVARPEAGAAKPAETQRGAAHPAEAERPGTEVPHEAARPAEHPAEEHAPAAHKAAPPEHRAPEPAHPAAEAPPAERPAERPASAEPHPGEHSGGPAAAHPEAQQKKPEPPKPDAQPHPGEHTGGPAAAHPEAQQKKPEPPKPDARKKDDKNDQTH